MMKPSAAYDPSYDYRQDGDPEEFAHAQRKARTSVNTLITHYAAGQQSVYHDKQIQTMICKLRC